jgi:hypothetical protein
MDTAQHPSTTPEPPEPPTNEMLDRFHDRKAEAAYMLAYLVDEMEANGELSAAPVRAGLLAQRVNVFRSTSAAYESAYEAWETGWSVSTIL